MTKRHLSIFIVIAIALSGCATGSAPVAKKATTQQPFPGPPDEPRYYFERSIRSNLDVLPDEDPSNNLMRSLTGAKRVAKGFVKPYAIAVHQGKVYVGDAPRRAVMVFDIPKQDFFMLGTEEDENGQGKLQRPMGLDIDKAGNVYVLDAAQKQVMVYTGDGKFQRAFGNPSMLYRPAGLAVTSDGARVYAVDIGGTSSDEHKIVVFNGITGERLPDIGKRGSKPGEFNLPRDVVISPLDDSIYVVDSGNFRVQKFDKEGIFIKAWGGIGDNPGQFSRPKEAAIDPKGNVAVVDTLFGNFQLFDSDGKLMMAVGNRSSTNGPGLYALPAGIAADDDGRFYIVDQYFTKVDVFRPAELPEDGGWIGKFNKIKMAKPEAVSADSAVSPPNSDAIDKPNGELPPTNPLIPKEVSTGN
ncbi:MAG: hypothetical protein ABL911_06740 [Gallionella sp.]|nr:6-bladed beta-propeller [Gallionella sp.]